MLSRDWEEGELVSVSACFPVTRKKLRVNFLSRTRGRRRRRASCDQRSSVSMDRGSFPRGRVIVPRGTPSSLSGRRTSPIGSRGKRLPRRVPSHVGDVYRRCLFAGRGRPSWNIEEDRGRPRKTTPLLRAERGGSRGTHRGEHVEHLWVSRRLAVGTKRVALCSRRKACRRGVNHLTVAAVSERGRAGDASLSMDTPDLLCLRGRARWSPRPDELGGRPPTKTGSAHVGVLGETTRWSSLGG